MENEEKELKETKTAKKKPAAKKAKKPTTPRKIKEETPIAVEASVVEESKPEVEEAKGKPVEAEVEEAPAAIDVPSEEESDFADEIKKDEPVAVEEAPKEEPEPEINLYAEKEEELEEVPAEETKPAENENDQEGKKGKKTEPTYEYNDINLAAIEEARRSFHKSYKKLNILKWAITGGGLALMIAGWIIPSVIQGINSNVTMYISLGVTAVVLIILAVYSFIFRKKVNKSMQEYFNTYYLNTDKYVYPTEIENMQGSVDDKLPQEIFLESNIYRDVVKVGSRAYKTFVYSGNRAVIADAAAQKKGDRQLETLFVGKFLKFENITTDDELLIYLKGNKRALPPNSLKGRKLIEDTRDMVIYGSGKARKLLTKKVKEALAQFNTNKTFVDMAVSVNEKGLFIAMGYEDDLMVLPLEKSFNPAPTTQFKNDMVKVLKLVDAFSIHHEDK